MPVVPLSEEDLGRLNSATKYPSIETYHQLGDKGRLTEDTPPLLAALDPTEDVILTEKIDGTNGRIIICPDGDWYIGSREEILYAKGDRIVNPASSIVPVLLPVAEQLALRKRSISAQLGVTWVFFLEVYGYRVTGAGKQYAAAPGQYGARVFDVAGVDSEVLTWEREKISAWREHGGQSFLFEDNLIRMPQTDELLTVPRLGVVKAGDLPRDLASTREFLSAYLPDGSEAKLDCDAGGQPEGIVLRATDRNKNRIAKARFQDYDRSLK